MSVVAPDRRRACLDARVPLPADAHPVVAFDDDELVVLNQEVDPRAVDVTAVLRVFGVDATGCDWTRIEPAPAGSEPDLSKEPRP